MIWHLLDGYLFLGTGFGFWSDGVWEFYIQAYMYVVQLPAVHGT